MTGIHSGIRKQNKNEITCSRCYDLFILVVCLKLSRSDLPDRSPVAAEAPKKYPVGRRTPPMSMHSFHSFLSSTSTMICSIHTECEWYNTAERQVWLSSLTLWWTILNKNMKMEYAVVHKLLFFLFIGKFWKLQVHKSWFCHCYVILYHAQLCIVFITCWIQIYWVNLD